MRRDLETAPTGVDSKFSTVGFDARCNLQELQEQKTIALTIGSLDASLFAHWNLIIVDCCGRCVILSDTDYSHFGSYLHKEELTD